jgi:hypothetical protein
MSIIVEDGSIVTNANSYCTESEFESYAEGIGVTVTGEIEPMLRKAAEFIGAHEANLKGDRVERAQPLAFPRDGIYVDGWYWTSAEIPRQVILCQMALALDINAGVDLYNKPVNPSLVAKRKRVEGAVEVEYADASVTAQKLSRSSRSDALLNSLLKYNGLVGLRMVRT